MKYRLLWLIPFGFVLFHCLGFVLLGDLSWYNQYLRIELMLMKLLSAVGYMIAAMSFRKKEYLRRGWMFLALGMLVFFINDIFFLASLNVALGDSITVYWLGAIVTMGNFFIIAGVFIVSRTWNKSGMDFSESGLKPWYVTILAIMLGFLVVGPSVISSLIFILQGKINAVVAMNIISGVGTTVALSLIARLLLTMLALRDTNLRWTWMFLCMVMFSWMFFDGFNWWGSTIGISEPFLTLIREMFRILACTFAISAGLAQRFVQQEIRLSKTT